MRFSPSRCNPSKGVKNACTGVKNDGSLGGYALIGAGGRVQTDAASLQKWPDGPEKFRCLVRRGTLNLALLTLADHRRASVLRKRASSEKKANIGSSDTAANPFASKILKVSAISPICCDIRRWNSTCLIWRAESAANATTMKRVCR